MPRPPAVVQCDNNYDPPICSDLYHNQEQSPEYPSGDGNCAAPNCDCGNGVPCGFYFWNHSSTTVVHGQTFLEWFRDSYIFDYQGTSPLVSGMSAVARCCARTSADAWAHTSTMCHHDRPCVSWPHPPSLSL